MCVLRAPCDNKVKFDVLFLFPVSCEREGRWLLALSKTKERDFSQKKKTEIFFVLNPTP